MFDEEKTKQEKEWATRRSQDSPNNEVPLSLLNSWLAAACEKLGENGDAEMYRALVQQN